MRTRKSLLRLVPEGGLSEPRSLSPLTTSNPPRLEARRSAFLLRRKRCLVIITALWKRDPETEEVHG